MEIWQTIILGLVEGLTEFLPISSTAHLVLFSRILGLAQSDFLKFFEIFIQAGAVLAVVVLYWKTLLRNWLMWKKILVAFLPAAILGFIFYKTIKNFLGETSVILWALALGGILLMVFEFFYAKRQKVQQPDVVISYKQAIVVGLCQSLAMVPGVSRSGATILGGLVLGINRKAIVEFSFLLAAPTIMAATGFDFYKTMANWQGNNMSMLDIWSLVIGFVIAFLVALLAIKSFLKFIQNHNFIGFGIYRILLAILFWLMIF